MTFEERVQLSETHIFKAVFPNTTNHYDTLFGGTAMQLMDEVAFITATRFARLKMVTVSSDKIDFNVPIPSGKMGNTSLDIKVDIYIELMNSDKRELAISGMFKFVAVGENKKPVRIDITNIDN